MSLELINTTDEIDSATHEPAGTSCKIQVEGLKNSVNTKVKVDVNVKVSADAEFETMHTFRSGNKTVFWCVSYEFMEFVVENNTAGNTVKVYIDG